MDEAISFEGENFRGSKTTGFREIALTQVQRVVTAGSKEFKKGFWIYSQEGNQASRKLKYIGDTRAEYFNSINSLHDILISKFDEDMEKKSTEIYNSIEVHYKKEENRSNLNFKTKKMRKLFQELCKFLERLGWLQDEVLED